MASSHALTGYDSDNCVLFVGRRTPCWTSAEIVKVAPTIAEASDWVTAHDYAVAVIDIDDGCTIDAALVANLRAIGRHAPVLLLTPPHVKVPDILQQTGATDVLLKPVSAEVLRARVGTFALLHRQKRDLARIRTLYDEHRRLTRQHLRTLTAVSTKLAACTTTDEVIQSFINEAHTAVGAVNSFVYMRKQTDERELELVAVSGIAPEALRLFQTISLDRVLPIVEAVTSRDAVWLSNGAELGERFPALEPRGQAQAIVALPVVVGSTAIGAVAFSFYEPRVWDIDKREFFLTLVAAFVAAIERSRLLLTERKARQDLERQGGVLRLLADVGALLSSSLDYESVLRQLTELLVPTIADWCTIDVMNSEGRIKRIAAHHADPAKTAILHDIERRYPADPEAAHGVPNVLRTGKVEWFPDTVATKVLGAERDEQHAALLSDLGVCSFVAVPLTARGRILGALSVAFAESGRQYSVHEVRYLEQLASRAALSLDNAKLYKDQVEAREALERQARHALLVGDVGTALTRSEGLGDALRRCAEALVRHLDVSLARIWTVDAGGAVLELQASAGIYTELDGEHARIPIGVLKLGTIARTGKPYLTNALPLEPWVKDSGCNIDRMTAFAGYPLIVDSGVIGVMALFSDRDLPTDTSAGLAAVADAVAIGIDRARADNRARVERDTLEVVNKVGRALAAELDHEKLVQLMTDSATRLAGAAFGAFFYNVVGADLEAYSLYALSGVPRETFAKFPMPRNTGVFAPTFAGERVVRVDDIRKDPVYGKNHPNNGMPEGHLPVASYLAVPVVSRTGAVIGGLFFGHPRPAVFTERHEVLVVGVAAQAAIALDNARLFKEAQRLITELDKSNKELDQFAYVASHDLKAPLRGISHLSQWLEEDLGDAMTETAKEQLGLMRRRVQRLEGLINGILNYSRAGRVREKVEHVDVAKILADTLEIIAPPADATTELPVDVPSLQAERVPLQQVFMNLLGNAFKHAKRPDPRVSIVAKDLGDFLEFRVTDNGPGIAPEFHERIWGIFQTLEPRDLVEGAGIGLSVVKKIVENKGGAVGVDSREGKGSTFWFTWPKLEKVPGNG